MTLIQQHKGNSMTSLGTTVSRHALPWHVVPLSARTESALEAITADLINRLKHYPDMNLADIGAAYHLNREGHGYRRMIMCRDQADALAALESRNPTRVMSKFQELADRPVVFMFPGQGSQSIAMAHDLYQNVPFFKQQVEQCAELLKPHLKLDLRHLLYPPAAHAAAAAAQLDQTAITQPALFVIEYALAQLWMAWGVRPQAMIGHSIGEYVAACLAGVFSLEDALAIVARRGQLMQSLPEGAMLSVPLPEHAINSILDAQLSLASINAPAMCVVSGPVAVVEAVKRQLAAQGVSGRRLRTSHAFHSVMMEPIVQPFTELMRSVPRHAPRIPYISNVTGTWITRDELADPHYWARHLRHTVRFADGITTLARQPGQVFLEVGPKQTLHALLKRHPHVNSDHSMYDSLRGTQNGQTDLEYILETLGNLWLAGVNVNWANVYAHRQSGQPHQGHTELEQRDD